jgi:hypothetical protein
MQDMQNLLLMRVKLEHNKKPNVYYLCNVDGKLFKATDPEAEDCFMGFFYLLEESNEYDFLATNGDDEIRCRLERNGDVCVAHTPHGEVYFEVMGDNPWELIPIDGKKMEELCINYNFYLQENKNE